MPGRPNSTPCRTTPRSDSWPRTKAPSLRRHYSTSTVLWASPTPQTARPVPRGRPVGSRSHRLGSPVLRAFSLCRHAIATTPAGSSQRSGCSPEFDDGGLPQMTAGSAPASKPFRGLLGVHACYGLPARGTAKRSFPSKAPAVSLPLLPLRLLLAGATVARWELHPLKNHTFARRTATQVLLGHESLETTMIYTQVARTGPAGVTSPLDLLDDITDEDLRAAVAVTATHVPQPD